MTVLTWFDDDLIEPDGPTVVDHVVIRLGGGRYAVCAPDVAEVSRPLGLTRVPSTPDWLCGVSNWRGHVLPVIDLRPLLGIPVAPLPSSARVVVVAVDDMEVGILAEAVSGLVEVPDECEAAPVTLTGAAQELIRGLADGGPAGPVAVLDTRAVLALRSLVSRSRA